MSLKGLTVCEIAGLAPAPYCGLILADHGANVLRIDRVTSDNPDTMSRGKRSIALDFKHAEGRDVFKRLIQSADVVIEPFRPGVMEKLGLGPKELMGINKRLIYARLSGFGQTGPWSKEAGHDINYISITGLLDIVGRKDEKPMFAANLLADFAGGGLMCALGILMACFERQTSGVGQIVDAAMNEGAAYLGSFLFNARESHFAGARGTNLLDSGAFFYETYETKDGKHMAVGAIEPQFYANLLRVLELRDPPYEQMDIVHWPDMKETFAKIFKRRTRAEWAQAFAGQDACVTPVLTLNEIETNEQMSARNVVLKHDSAAHGDTRSIAAAPRLSRTPGANTADATGPRLRRPLVGEHTIAVLRQLDYAQTDIDRMLREGVIGAVDTKKAKL